MKLNLDLNLLVALDALLNERSVTRAAQREGVGQPAMSASLARLRRHFNDPLLAREGRGLALTPFGASLLEPVATAVIAVEAAMARPDEFDPRHDQRRFAIIASDYVLVVLLRKLLAVLPDEAPGVQLTVMPMTADYDERLLRDQVDMVIVPSEVTPANFRYPGTRLFTDRYVLAVDRDNPDIGDTVTETEFAALSYASYTSLPSRPLIDRQLESRGIHRRIVVGTSSFIGAPFLLRGTGLACLVQERLALEVAEAAHLRTIDLPIELEPMQEWGYWHPRHDLDPAHRWLRERLGRLVAT